MYPFKPHTCKFLTKIYHPNINSKDGRICRLLYQEDWNPYQNVKSTIKKIEKLIVCPNLKNFIEEKIAL